MPWPVRVLALVLVSIYSTLAVVTTTSCGRSSDPSSVVDRVEASAFNGAVVTLLVLDRVSAEQIAATTTADEVTLKRFEERVQRLERAAALLETARAWLSGEKPDDPTTAIRDAVALLGLVADELRADKVPIPDSAMRALALARRL